MSLRCPTVASVACCTGARAILYTCDAVCTVSQQRLVPRCRADQRWRAASFRERHRRHGLRDDGFQDDPGRSHTPPNACSREAATARNNRLSCVAGSFASALAFRSPVPTVLATIVCLACSSRIQRDSGQASPFAWSRDKSLSRVAAETNAPCADEARVHEKSQYSGTR